jgi:hypothetical protein
MIGRFSAFALVDALHPQLSVLLSTSSEKYQKVDCIRGFKKKRISSISHRRISIRRTPRVDINDIAIEAGPSLDIIKW